MAFDEFLFKFECNASDEYEKSNKTGCKKLFRHRWGRSAYARYLVFMASGTRIGSSKLFHAWYLNIIMRLILCIC